MAELQIPYVVDILDDGNIAATVAEVEAVIDNISTTIATTATITGNKATVSFVLPETFIPSRQYQKLVAALEAMGKVQNVSARAANDL